MEKAVCERKFADGLFAYYESVAKWTCFKKYVCRYCSQVGIFGTENTV